MKVYFAQTLKEIVRHYLYVFKLYSVINFLKASKGYKVDHLTADSRSERFKLIYKTGVWVENNHQESKSGVGSSTSSTDSIRSILPIFIKHFDIKYLVDCGCGDLAWMSCMDIGIRYTGLDIADDIINSNISRYSSEFVDFQVRDIVEENIPDCDATLCREILFHLNFHDAKKVLQNLKKHSKYLMVTTDNSVLFNSDIKSGDYRRVNLNINPFNFPDPLLSIRDNNIVDGRTLSIWEANSLPFF